MKIFREGNVKVREFKKGITITVYEKWGSESIALTDEEIVILKEYLIDLCNQKTKEYEKLYK